MLSFRMRTFQPLRFITTRLSIAEWCSTFSESNWLLTLNLRLLTAHLAISKLWCWGCFIGLVLECCWNFDKTFHRTLTLRFLLGNLLSSGKFLLCWNDFFRDDFFVEFLFRRLLSLLLSLWFEEKSSLISLLFWRFFSVKTLSSELLKLLLRDFFLMRLWTSEVHI